MMLMPMTETESLRMQENNEMDRKREMDTLRIPLALSLKCRKEIQVLHSKIVVSKMDHKYVPAST